jgi:hypothetical protein
MIKTLYYEEYELKNLLKILAYFSLATLLLYQGNSYLSAQIPNSDLKTDSGTNNKRIFETFSFTGLISSLVINENMSNTSSSTLDGTLAAIPVEYIEAGNWSLSVIDKKIRNFEINFTMVHPDGSDWHYHELSNFQPVPDIPVLLEEDGTTFTGAMDLGEDNMDRWFGVQTTVNISNLNTITIFLDPADTENHFGGQPIYGIIQSLMDKNGSPIISSRL